MNMSSESIYDIARKLTALGERQGDAARKAADLVIGVLEAHGIPYVTETIETAVPVGTATLEADGVVIPSLPTSFVGGAIEGNSSIVSSLISSRYLIDVPNINFNPRCRGISRSNFYFAPSVAVAARDVGKVIEADSVSANVTVETMRIGLPQILVGNMKSPRSIVFSHFDSVGSGAIDNASGTAVCLSAILSDPRLLEDALFVFDPNEELSYDFPTYWGHGYRVFEQRHGGILSSAKKILVVDCVGNGVPEEITDQKILNLAFPIAGIASLYGRVSTIGADISQLMEVYHSDDDRIDFLDEASLKAARDMIVSLI